MKFSVFQISRKGGRSRNEDRMGYCYTREAALFLLADGMGGHPRGDVAAQLALQTMAARFQREAQPRVPCPVHFLNAALVAAHQAIVRHGYAHYPSDPPRTTLVAAMIQDDHLHWIHCGDSRLYLVREGQLLARTRDHSYLAHRTLAHSSYPHEDAIHRNVLFTCLGSATDPIHDPGGPVYLRQGDKFLLCSDGLWDSLDQARIVDSLSAVPVAQAVPQLAEEALRRGGPQGDNVTLIAVEWEKTTAAGATEGVSTEGLSEGVFASTIQCSVSGAADPAADDLDEAAIERSIAEINDAIRRAADRRASAPPVSLPSALPASLPRDEA
jgi:serine/threonine protein phosphatase PrpC